MEKTLTNKDKFFAQYWGQSIAKNYRTLEENIKVDQAVMFNSDFCLKVKNLKFISKDDAAEIALIILKDLVPTVLNVTDGYNYRNQPQYQLPANLVCIEVEKPGYLEGEKDIELVIVDPEHYCIETISLDNFINPDPEFPETFEKPDALLTLEAFQFLQSKGYALPFRGADIDTLTRYGWILF